MEGSNLDFFVTYKDHQAIITMSEYDTVEQLKVEIDNNFSIPVMDQKLTGWHSIPESDDMLLQSCSKPIDINCLVVTYSASAVTATSYMDEILLLNNPMEADTDESNKKMEKEARKSLEVKQPKIPFKLQDVSFQDAIFNIVSSSQKKALLLYLHNSKDIFSQNFLNFDYDDDLADILENKFAIIGWDIEDQSYHNALISALEPFGSLSFIAQLITERTSAAVCLLLDNDEPFVFSCLKGDQSYQNILEILRNLQALLDVSDSPGGASATRKPEEFAQKYEMEAIESLRRKMPSSTSIIFRSCHLDDALTFICTSEFDERRVLLLYLHNSDQPFSKMFFENLGNGEFVQILNRSFFILGWDVEDPKYHDALADALSRHVNLLAVSNLVTNKVSIGLCILPISGNISVFSCLRGKMSVKETVKKLKEVEKVFRDEIDEEKELKLLEEKSNENDMGPEKLHGIWADELGDRDYDSFEYDQGQFLMDKIGFALRGPPQNMDGYDKKTKVQIEAIYKIITAQSNKVAEFKDKVEIAFIYNCLVPLPKEKVKREKKFKDYKPQTDVNPVPIFVLRKCRDSDNPCRIFIDDNGRVYQSWRGYLTENKFPKCEMIVPLNGRYQVVDDVVQLEKHLTPACHLDTKLLQAGDIVSTAAALASGAIFIGATIPAIPVAAPLLIAAGAVGIGAGLWAIGRSTYTLIDRSIHKETMSFANSEARGAYLNIVAGSLGFVGAGANMAITQLAKSGFNIGQLETPRFHLTNCIGVHLGHFNWITFDVIKTAEVALQNLGATNLVNTVRVLNIGAGGTNLVNSGYDVFEQWYHENQTTSALTILQLNTSVLFFGHAVYNFKWAHTIIDETQARVLKDYNDSLRSNRHREAFNKLTKETVRTQEGGAKAGRTEVISAIRNIQNKDEVFAALIRNNKAMNKAGVKFSTEGGEIKLSGMAVDMNELIGLNKKQTETFLGNLPQQPISQQPMTASSTTMASNNSILKTAVNELLLNLHVDTSGLNMTQIIKLTIQLLDIFSGDVRTKVVIAVTQAIRYVLTKLARPLAEEIDQIIPKNMQYFHFLRIGISYFSSKVDEWEQKYQMYERTKDARYCDPLFAHVNPLYAKRTVELFEFVVRNSYSGMTLATAVLMEISGYLTAWVVKVIFQNEQQKESEQRRRIHSASFQAMRVNCPSCGGHYFQHPT